MAYTKIVLNAQRYRIGENHHRAKLTDEQVSLIRVLRAVGFRFREIAEIFGIAVSTAHAVATDVIRSQKPVYERQVKLSS